MGVESQRYIPVGVSPFSLIKPTAPADGPEDTDLFNGELLAIEAAFNEVFSVIPPAAPTLPASTILLSSHSRNALVDLSPLKNGGQDNYVKVVLPPHPSVGDPPCFVVVQLSGYGDDNTSREAVVIVTTDDDFAVDENTPSQGLTRINGMTPDNINYSNVIALFGTGDVARFTYIDPLEGWHVSTNLSIVVNPNDSFNWPARGAFPWPQQHFHIASSNPKPILPIAVYRPGEWFAMTNGSVSIPFGDSSYRFNGVPGPFTVPGNFKRNRFTCLGPKVFSVQRS
jgi:hypothetical protein